MLQRDVHQDTLRIEDLRVDCIVGVYPHERQATQPLHVDLTLHLDTEAAASEEKISQTVDYASLASQIVFLLRSCRFGMLETAAHVIARYLLLPPNAASASPVLSAATVCLRKPGALSGFATPQLTVTRQAGWAAYTHEEKTWGSVDIIAETQSVGVYRLNLSPGSTLPLHYHERMRESEMILSDDLHCQHKWMPQGTVHRWPHGAKHLYENKSARWQNILCVDAPRFIPEDEIQATGTPDSVPAEPPWGPLGHVQKAKAERKRE